MTCAHANDGLCLVSTALAGTHVPLDERACSVCVCKHPQFVNEVTYGRAIYTLRMEGRDYLPLLKQHQQKHLAASKPNRIKPISTERAAELRARVVEKTERNRRLLGWIDLLKRPSEKLGDATLRLAQDATGRDIAISLTRLLSRYACKHKNAVEAMNRIDYRRQGKP